MAHEENTRPEPGGVLGGDQKDTLQSARDDAGRILETIRGDAGESRAELATWQARAIWRWAQTSGHCLKHADYENGFKRGGQEHRVWVPSRSPVVYKATFAGKYGWVACMDVRFNKRTQEDEPYIGMGDATPFEYLDRLQIQNEVFKDDTRLLGCWIEAEGLVLVTSQPLVRGKSPLPAEILEFMNITGSERIPGLPANSEDCFSFYRREDRVAAFDAHTGNYVRTTPGFIVPIDLVMVRANDAMHDYLCRRIDAAKS